MVSPGNTEGGSTTVLLTCCITGLDLVCFANKNKNCQLSYSWFQTSQWYSDTSPFSIPWFHQQASALQAQLLCWRSFLFKGTHQEDRVLLLALVPSESQVALDPDVEGPAALGGDDMVVELVGSGRQGRAWRLLLTWHPLGNLTFLVPMLKWLFYFFTTDCTIIVAMIKTLD